MSKEEPGKDIFIGNLRRLIDDNNINQTELAKGCGVSPSMVSLWLSGKNYPRIGVMQKIADFFRIPITELTAQKNDDHKNDNIAKFSTMLSQLSEDNQKLIVAAIEGFLRKKE